MFYYFAVYKPFRVLSQFTSQEGKQTLKEIFRVPRDVYPVGRLDYDSEGLLLLTNDKQLNHRVLHPSFAHEREYWAQLEGDIDQSAIDDLQRGVTINVNGKNYLTGSCKAAKFAMPPPLPERNPPIRYRKNIPTSWISIIVREGKNRQVRKMTAQVGFPVLRLVRYRIATLTLDKLLPGEIRALEKEEIYRRLFNDR